MSKTATALAAAASAAAPAAIATTVVAAPAAPARAEKPKHLQPTPRRKRDAYTGKAGTYLRDPATGERIPIQPEASAPGADAPAAA